jgi:hypothetical protein
MTPLEQQRTAANGAVASVSYRERRRRRRPDLGEWLFGIVLGGALAVSALLVLALGMGAVWLIVVVVQDLARRLAG